MFTSAGIPLFSIVHSLAPYSAGVGVGCVLYLDSQPMSQFSFSNYSIVRFAHLDFYSKMKHIQINVACERYSTVTGVGLFVYCSPRPVHLGFFVCVLGMLYTGVSLDCNRVHFLSALWCVRVVPCGTCSA